MNNKNLADHSPWNLYFGKTSVGQSRIFFFQVQSVDTKTF